jgi:hypothetical protein
LTIASRPEVTGASLRRRLRDPSMCHRQVDGKFVLNSEEVANVVPYIMTMEWC